MFGTSAKFAQALALIAISGARAISLKDEYDDIIE